MLLMTHSDCFVGRGGVFNHGTTAPREVQLSPVEYSLLTRMTQPQSATTLTVEESVTVARLIDLGLLVQVDSNEHAGPGLWEKYGWGRARRVVLEATRDSARETERPSVMAPGEIRSPFAYEHLPELLRRSCARFFRPDPVDASAFIEVMRQFRKAVRDLKWLKTYIVIQGVKGFRRRVYNLDEIVDGDGSDDGRKYKASTLLECVQHQWWCGGTGFCVFFAVDLEKLKIGENNSRGYIELYIRLGEVGQELVHAAYCNGLAGWMTPAVRESKVCFLLGIDDAKEEPLYFLKFGLRDTEFEESFGADGLNIEKCDYETLRPYDRKTQNVHNAIKRRGRRHKRRQRHN